MLTGISKKQIKRVFASGGIQAFFSYTNENPYYVCDPAVAEPSIMYSEYLDKYLVATLKGSSISLLASDKISGPYDEIYPVIDSSDYFGLYGGFITPLISDSDGKRIYIQLSQWTPIYNTSLVEVILK